MGFIQRDEAVELPARLDSVDACVVAAKCGAALVVTRKHKNKVSGLQDLVASMAGSSVQLLGAVVNEF